MGTVQLLPMMLTTGVQAYSFPCSPRAVPPQDLLPRWGQIAESMLSLLLPAFYPSPF